jgi:hypothetical protein
MKLLSRDPADRYGSAAELVEALNRIRNGLTPVTSSAAGTPSAAFTDAPTLALKPSARDGVTGSTTGTARRKTLWILMSIAVLAVALGIVGWGLFRDAILTGAPGRGWEIAARGWAGAYLPGGPCSGGT